MLHYDIFTYVVSLLTFISHLASSLLSPLPTADGCLSLPKC